MKIAFIGLGIMGKPMATNLLNAGYALTVYDINAGTVAEMVQLGAKAAASCKDAAKGCDVTITMLPASPHVKEAAIGENGIIYGAPKGSVLIDMSSISPSTAKEIGSELEKAGIHMLDAPVSGGEPKAVDGTLSIMVGGKREVFEKYYNILMTLGSSAVLCGEIGAGNTTKLANQIIVALNIAAVSEALMFGAKAGLDPEVMYNAIRGGLAGSTVLDVKAPMMIARNDKPGGKIDLHFKDLMNALDAGKEAGMPLPLTSYVAEIMQALRAQGKGELDHSAIVQFYEGITNFKLK